MILCNARILNAPLTGVQRYLQELLVRLPEVQTIKPSPYNRGPLGHLWEQTLLPRQLGKQDILWSPSTTGPLAVRKQIVTVHDLAPLECPEGFSTAFRGYYTWLLPRLLPRVEAIISVSEFTRQRMMERYGISRDRIHVTPLGVDRARFNPQSKTAIEAVRANYNLPSRYILVLGALSGRKNITRLIQAWAEAQKHQTGDTALVIAGAAGASHVFDGTTLPKLPPRTILTGRVPDADLPPLLGGAALFAFPSLYEGFGLPILEAMACGTPCLIANCTSVPEVAGEAALRVTPTDVADIASGILKILNDHSLSTRLSMAGLERARTFTWENSAAQTRAVFNLMQDGILPEHPPRPLLPRPAY